MSVAVAVVRVLLEKRPRLTAGDVVHRDEASRGIAAELARFRSPAVDSAKPNLSFANNISGFSSHDFVGIRQTQVGLFCIHYESHAPEVVQDEMWP